MALIWQASTMRWSIGASCGRLITSKPAPMCSDSTMFSSQIAANIGSQCPDRKLGNPCTCGVSRKLIERQPFFPSRCTSSHREIDVPHRDDAERDEPVRVAAGPLVDGPVVVAPERDERELLVARLGEGAGVEPGHRREVHRAEHPVGVHVAHPLVHVEAARPQLGVAARVEAPLLSRPADSGGHTERGGRPLALEHPLVHATVVADDLRDLVLPLRGDVVLVHVGRLDHVVVDAHQDHVVHLHGVSSQPVMTGNLSQPRTCAVGASVEPSKF